MRFQYSRAPNSALPTRTCVAPSMIAVSKSPLIPMLSLSRPLSRASLSSSAKNGAGSISAGRYAHQTDYRDIGVARHLKQFGQVGDGTAALLRLLADIDLDEARYPLPGLVERLGERLDQARPVERVDAVEQFDRVLRLVRLQAADEMERHVWIALSQRRPFGLRLLYPILAEHAVTGRKQRFDRFGRVSLADCDEGHLVGLAPGNPAGAGNTIVDFAKG